MKGSGGFVVRPHAARWYGGAGDLRVRRTGGLKSSREMAGGMTRSVRPAEDDFSDICVPTGVAHERHICNVPCKEYVWILILTWRSRALWRGFVHRDRDQSPDINSSWCRYAGRRQGRQFASVVSAAIGSNKLPCFKDRLRRLCNFSGRVWRDLRKGSLWTFKSIKAEWRSQSI